MTDYPEGTVLGNIVFNTEIDLKLGAPRITRYPPTLRQTGTRLRYYFHLCRGRISRSLRLQLLRKEGWAFKAINGDAAARKADRNLQRFRIYRDFVSDTAVSFCDGDNHQ